MIDRRYNSGEQFVMYSKEEIERIAEVAFEAALKTRSKPIKKHRSF